MWATCLRFGFSSLVLLALSHFAPALGKRQTVDAALSRRLWWGPGLSFTVYILSFIWALKFTTASNVALYFATSPVFAMLWDKFEGQVVPWRRTLLAAALTFIGVLWLFLPTLSSTSFGWFGDSLACLGSLLWVNYSHLCRRYQGHLPATKLTSAVFWRTAVLLAPFAIYDQFTAEIHWKTSVVLAHVYATLGPSIIAFLAWAYALKHWPTSQVMLFVNLIPLLTALWARVILGEQIQSQFWVAMIFVAAGVSISLSRSKSHR